MSIITISRGSSSYGKETAEKLAEKLGYECVSREILIEASEQFNIPEIKLIHAIHDNPSVFNRFTHGKEKYIAYIRAALLRHLQKDNVIYHGFAGHFFLKGISHVLKIRIIADMDDRIKIVMKRDNVPREQAQRIIEKDDAERHKWSRSLYGIDTWDSTLYDIVLRINKLTMDTAIEIILNAIKQPALKTTAESQLILDNLTTSALIEAKLINEFPTIRAFVENGNARIKVKTFIDKTEESTAKIKDVVKKIEGVETVELDIIPFTLDVKA